MPLDVSLTYTIRNKKTGTFLDLTGDPRLFATGWGWLGRNSQKWKLIRVGDAADNNFRLQNENDNCFLFSQPQVDGTRRLIGWTRADVFKIEEAGGAFSIKLDLLAVTLVTGQDVPNIAARDRVFDIYADRTPIILQVADGDTARWSFIPDPPAVTPLGNGAYKIVNFQTGTVLDVANTVNRPVHGLVSKGEDHHKWTITVTEGDNYTIKNSTVEDNFLAPGLVDQVANGIALIGKPAQPAQPPRHFTAREVPGTGLYKIFLDPADTDGVSGLAVNLAVVDGVPDSLDGTVVSLQAAEAQKWYFVKVQT